MNIPNQTLLKFSAKVFKMAGCEEREAEVVAKHLVEANLVGHDSHGLIRVLQYVKWLKEGKVFANKHITTIIESASFAVLDGNFGFGQIIGEETVKKGVEMASKNGVAIVGLRNSGHLGRIGDWSLMAADAGLISLHFVNSNGFAMLAVPFGGSDRRLSSNPISIGVPRGDKPAVLLDMATCKVAEGKIMVAKNKGINLPEDTILSGTGESTCDPNIFYTAPLGSILPIAPGHKGYGLAVMCELLAGALSGGDTSSPESPTVSRMVNGMLSIYIDPKRFGDDKRFLAEIIKLENWIKASPPNKEEGEILFPGEPELRTKTKRLAEGVPLDDGTTKQLIEAALFVGLNNEDIKFLKV